jgi:hypothetical protein
MHQQLRQLRPRFRLRTLLLLVALVSVAIAGWRAWQREHEALLRREHYQDLVAQLEHVAANLDDMARGEEDMAQKSRESARRWREGRSADQGPAPPRSAADEAEQCEKRAAEFERMAEGRRRTSAAVHRLLPGIRRAAARLARGDDPAAEAELRRLIGQLP